MNIATLLVAGLANGSLYALIALGLVLLYKTQDLINFAYGEIFMFGAFAAYIGLFWLHLPYWAAFLAAVASVAAFGAILERLAFRRLVNETHLTLAMVTVGLSFAMKGAARIPFGSDIYTLPPIFAAAPIRIGSVIIAPQALATIVIAVLITVGLFTFFAFSTLGKQMQATQQNAEGARLVGININRVMMTTWALSASLGAAAGVIAAPSVLLYPDMGVSFLLKGFAAAVLGGLESIPGAIIGGFTVGIIEMLVGGFITTEFQSVSPFFIIVIVLFIRPSGLFGRQKLARV